jgi:hypothetical protein
MFDDPFRRKSAETIAAESDREQRLYDSLGPFSREAIRNSPRIIDIAKTISRFKRDRNDCDAEGIFHEIDFKSPAGDARFAEYVKKTVIGGVLGKPADSFVLTRHGRPLAHVDVQERHRARQAVRRQGDQGRG